MIGIVSLVVLETSLFLVKAGSSEVVFGKLFLCSKMGSVVRDGRCFER